MLVLKRTMILGIAVFLIVWTALLSVGPIVGGASESSAPLPPTLVSPFYGAWVTENKPTFEWIFNDPDLGDSQSGFNLQISTDMSFSTLVQNITVKSSTQSYTSTIALNDGMYYWRVKANDTSGFWSDWSFPWLVNIDTTPPNPVTDVSVRVLKKFEVREREIGGQFVNLTWTASDDPHFMQYEIYVSTDPSVLGTSEATTIFAYYDELEIGPRELEPDTTYYLSVVVVDQAGLPSEAATVSLTTNPPINWSLIGGIAVAVEVAIAAMFVAIKLFVKKE